MAHSHNPPYTINQQQLTQQQQQYGLQQAEAHPNNQPQRSNTRHTSNQNHYEMNPQQQQQQHTQMNNQANRPHTHNHSHQNSHHHEAHSHSHKKKSSSSRRNLPTRVFAAGYNYNYQFGLNENENHTDMIELEWCRGLNISYISAGLTHNIYLSFTGNYYFCGQIDTEKLGFIDSSNGGSPTNQSSAHNMDKISKSTAVTMDDFSDVGLNVTRVGDGVSARHMIVISRHRAYTMGMNQRGQLGLGHFRSTLSFARVRFDSCREDIDNYVGLDVVDVSGGEAHSAFVVMPHCTLPIKRILRYFLACFVAADYSLTQQHRICDIISKYLIVSGDIWRGRLYVCGCNNFGQLGIGNKSDSSCINRCVRVSIDSSIAQVSCGENHTVCLDNRGRVYCFGDNYYGQSGVHLNHYENVYYPVRIEHFKKQYAARIVKISSGKYHCVALDKLGRVFCWGLGAYGQLGCNKLNKRIILPIYVDALHHHKITDVRAGMYHTAALTNQGQLFCWGSNNYGQCFTPQKENVITPQIAQIDQIKNNKNLIIYRIFCGYYSTLVLVRDISHKHQ
eukprot:73346_1